MAAAPVDRLGFERPRPLKVFWTGYSTERRNHQAPVGVAPKHRRQDHVLRLIGPGRRLIAGHASRPTTLKAIAADAGMLGV
jgi:hypothetical protein